jgi:hypothetical protein
VGNRWSEGTKVGFNSELDAVVVVVVVVKAVVTVMVGGVTRDGICFGVEAGVCLS